MNKLDIIKKTLNVEGGYVNDPSDSGGETNYGITLDVARDFGYKGKMIDLTLDQAIEIYSKKYWSPLRLDKVICLSDIIAEKLFDIGVNMGKKRAILFLQRVLNYFNKNHYDELIVDGLIGDKTIRALEILINYRGHDGIKQIHKALNCLQGEFYISLTEKRPKDRKFSFGWFKNRINDCQAHQ